jgi:hypothetical protein
MTEDEVLKKIESLKSDKGGWNKEDLESLGVSWPPPKGWKEEVVRNNT